MYQLTPTPHSSAFSACVLGFAKPWWKTVSSIFQPSSRAGLKEVRGITPLYVRFSPVTTQLPVSSHDSMSGDLSSPVVTSRTFGEERTHSAISQSGPHDQYACGAMRTS